MKCIARISKNLYIVKHEDKYKFFNKELYKILTITNEGLIKLIKDLENEYLSNNIINDQINEFIIIKLLNIVESMEDDYS